MKQQAVHMVNTYGEAQNAGSKQGEQPQRHNVPSNMPSRPQTKSAIPTMADFINSLNGDG